MSKVSVSRAGSNRATLESRSLCEIQRSLSSIGVVFDELPLAPEALDMDASQDEIIEEHRELLNTLMGAHGFVAIDVLNVPLGFTRMAKLQRNLQPQHHHPEAQGRLFLEGGGWFHLRAGEQVYSVYCNRGVFISLPAMLDHWFDMDTSKPMCSVRLYAAAQQLSLNSINNKSVNEAVE